MWIVSLGLLLADDLLTTGPAARAAATLPVFLKKFRRFIDFIFVSFLLLCSKEVNACLGGYRSEV
jgi:hypothetical protein